MKAVSRLSVVVVVAATTTVALLVARPERALAASSSSAPRPPPSVDAFRKHRDRSVDGSIRESLEELSSKIDDYHAVRERRRASSDRRPRRRRRRPFVTLAYAQSIDGKIALASDPDGLRETANDAATTTTTTTSTSSNFAISGPESLRLTHALRSVHDAILVGGKTLSVDNPRLSNRLWPPDGEGDGDVEGDVVVHRKQPVPVVLDTHLRHLRALGTEMKARNPIVCCGAAAYRRAKEEGYRPPPPAPDDDDGGGVRDRPSWEGMPSSVTLLPCETIPVGGGAAPGSVDGAVVVLDLPDVLRRLREETGIESLMVEGGATVLSLFAEETFRNDDDDDDDDAGLFDCLCVTISPKLLGASGLDSMSSSLWSSPSSPKAAAALGPLKCITLGDDVVLFADRR